MGGKNFGGQNLPRKLAAKASSSKERSADGH